MRHCLILVVLAGCEPISEDLPGHLAQVEITATVDDCVPTRFVGDAGVQFIGTRADGGLAFTLPQHAFYGAQSTDGGEFQGVIRGTVPTPDKGRQRIADDDACVGTFSDWTTDVTAAPASFVLKNSQSFPGLNDCTIGPSWLPEAPCTSKRVVTFTVLSECNLNCVQITAAGEVSCGC